MKTRLEVLTKIRNKVAKIDHTRWLDDLFEVEGEDLNVKEARERLDRAMDEIIYATTALSRAIRMEET